jgi:hypothetical protein
MPIRTGGLTGDVMRREVVTVRHQQRGDVLADAKIEKSLGDESDAPMTLIAIGEGLVKRRGGEVGD